MIWMGEACRSKLESDYYCCMLVNKKKLVILQGVIDIISKKWALLVINEIGNHRRIRFNELRNELRDITAKTLTR